jgi:hypothetical protein
MDTFMEVASELARGVVIYVVLAGVFIFGIWWLFGGFEKR